MMATGCVLGGQSLQKLLCHAHLNIGVMEIACGMRERDGPLARLQLFDLPWEREQDGG